MISTIKLMKTGLLSLMLLTMTVVMGQEEEVGPITVNFELAKHGLMESQEVNTGTFDSTFIYITDTLSLPFLDDFSRDKFQKYNANYTDTGVTSTKKYKLLDNGTDLPLPATAKYSSTPTFTRYYDIANGTSSDTTFASQTIKVGDLSKYPVVYSPVEVYPPYIIYDTLDYPNPKDTIWLTSPDVVQDSATQFFAQINDPNALWLDNTAYHNYRYAVNPWTLGVATFDGLDANGYPYAIGTTSSGYADYLTSKPLDLSTKTLGDSIYFSFLYQPQGFGDIPETSDSLILEFYNKDNTNWDHIWSTNGKGLSDFKVVHIPLTNAAYYKKGFQFRFKNYGALSGALDHFNLDYVNLRTSSGKQDTLFKDFAFVYPLNSLLKDYTSVPWDHYKNNFSGKMSPAVNVVVRNGSNLPENNQNGKSEIFYNAGLEGSFTLTAQTLSGGNINYGPRTTYSSFHDFSTGYHFDESKPGNKATFDIVTTAASPFPNLAINDSTFGKQVFRNYYSYDDGSAEAAYGPTGKQARLAIKYTSYESDSLIGVLTHFVPSVTDVSSKLFLLTVWDDNNGKPGNVIYEDDIFFPRQPVYEPGIGLFHHYFFKDTLKVKLSGTFYVGWRQFDLQRLNIGLDRNINNKDKTFYSVDGGGTWKTSTIDGSVMLRPIFSTGMDVELGIKEQHKIENTFVVYPNPTNNSIHVKTISGEFNGMTIMDIRGNIILKTNESSADLSSFSNGIYLIRIEGNESKVIKVIKN